jgi:hypothetical protein
MAHNVFTATTAGFTKTPGRRRTKNVKDVRTYSK